MAEDLEDAVGTLEEMEDSLDAGERRRVQDAIAVLRGAHRPVTKVVGGFDRRDAAEAVVGSAIFGIPMLAESGTFEIGAYIATRPLYYALTVMIGIGIVVGLLYATDFRRVKIVNPYFGIIPRRVVAVLGIALATSLVLTTAWGRAEWADPTIAWGQVTFVAVVMAIGAAITDIIPAE